MDIKTFEAIKGKIDLLKQKKAKAEGAIESIMEAWEKTYGFKTVKEAEQKYNELEDDIGILDTKIEGLYKDLTAITNWNLI